MKDLKVSILIHLYVIGRESSNSLECKSNGNLNAEKVDIMDSIYYLVWSVSDQTHILLMELIGRLAENPKRLI